MSRFSNNHLLYLDNAATSFPKPPRVMQAVQQCMVSYGGNPGRGSHTLAARAADAVYSCREAAGEFFHTEPERIVFTQNATHGLNTVIKGYLRPGDHVLISDISHNAVYRPVYRLSQDAGISFDVYTAGLSGAELWAELRSRIRPNTRMVVVTHMSNVSSLTDSLPEIAAFCRQFGLLCIVDAAQSAGHIPVYADMEGVTAVCVPGHKGLFGPMGTGLIAFSDHAPVCGSLTQGGSGVLSLSPDMPEDLPEHLEAGTLAVPAIAGLCEGIRFVSRHPELYQKISRHSSWLWEEMHNIRGVTLYGGGDGGIISFVIDGISPADTAAYLDRCGICVRSGYHCAPLAHRKFGSMDTGTVRLSFGMFNTGRDAARVLDAVSKCKKILL
ncbi:MAG: aminotransferase class V-fold PLP-dependent enzyme [Clostridia bacterium]|nr:aminotransferase class V-fold PLP-dependent enzyme [Clostridia bacterium]